MDAIAAGTTGLVLTGKLLDKLIRKNIITVDEAYDIIRASYEAMDDESKPATKAALREIFPNAPI